MAETSPDAADRFWAWSLDVYGDPAVAASCLALQDEHGADVNLLLFLLWRASCGDAPPEPAAIAALDAAIAPWRTLAIRPLRTMRRALKGMGEERVRRHVAAAELEAERSAQRRLIAAWSGAVPAESGSRARTCAAIGLRRYCPNAPVALVDTLLDKLD